MSNVGNGENDFEGLEDLNLSEDVVNRIKQSRMFAREAINKLEPRHILGWNHLRVILADVLMNLDAEIKLLEMIKKSEEILKRANEICALYNIRAEFLGDNKSVGVQGDNRTYTSIICLILQEDFKDWETLAELSNKISSELPINRITLEIEHLKTKS